MRIILTGASMGIGEAAARALAAPGVRLALVARTRDKLEKSVESVKAGGGEAFAVVADLSRPEEAARVVPESLEKLGGVDVLINNAGVGIANTFAAMKMEDMRHLMEVNLFSVTRLMQDVIPPMRAQGGGHIINISSVVSKISLPTAGSYSASKFALNGISDAALVELAGDKIKVTTLCPGVVSSNFHTNLLGGARKPAGPSGWTPDQVAAAIVRAVKNPPRERTLGAANKALVGLSRVSPGFVNWLLGKLYDRRIRPALTRDADG